VPKDAVTKLTNLDVVSSPLQESQPTALCQLKYTEPTELYLRDGEVVIHRRPGSVLWHCRFRLQDGSWYRQTTRQASIEYAVRIACDLYDETRFRQRLGLAQKSHTFAEIGRPNPNLKAKYKRRVTGRLTCKTYNISSKIALSKIHPKQSDCYGVS
jgi:hypothetical protein